MPRNTLTIEEKLALLVKKINIAEREAQLKLARVEQLKARHDLLVLRGNPPAPLAQAAGNMTGGLGG